MEPTTGASGAGFLEKYPATTTIEEMLVECADTTLKTASGFLEKAKKLSDHRTEPFGYIVVKFGYCASCKRITPYKITPNGFSVVCGRCQGLYELFTRKKTYLLARDRRVLKRHKRTLCECNSREFQKAIFVKLYCRFRKMMMDNIEQINNKIKKTEEIMETF